MERFQKIYSQGIVSVMEIWVDTEIRGPLSVSPGRKRGGVYTAAGSGRKTCGKTIAPQIRGKWDPRKASRGTVSYVPTYK